MELTNNDIQLLYGKRFFLVDDIRKTSVEEKIEATEKDEKIVKNEVVTEQNQPDTKKPVKKVETKSKASDSISWKLKETSRVLFILHPNEYADKKLMAFLKNIAEKSKIGIGKVGFGVILKKPSDEVFENMPAKFAIVFDSKLQNGKDNPWTVNDKTILFTHKLSELENDEQKKISFWNPLKDIIAQLKSES